MKYAVLGMLGVLAAFFLYIAVSLYTVNRLVRRIQRNAAAMPALQHTLRTAQEKLVWAMKKADSGCTVADRTYGFQDGQITSRALLAVNDQIAYYFTRSPQTSKCEAVYQHLVTYRRHYTAFEKNETECRELHRRLEGFCKSRVLGAFAEAAMDKLPHAKDAKEGILGFGLMRLPMIDGTEVDIPQCMAMADCMIQQGFTYFDTAYFYLDGRSECVAKAILTDRYPRGSFRLADKMPMNHLKEAQDVARIFEEQLARTGAGYFDYYLLHALNNNSYEKQSKKFGVFEFIADKKSKGIVRQMGFSFHDKPEVLEKILSEHPEVDFVQLQLNYFDWESKDVAARRCYEVARAHGKPIVVMEPIKGGNLAVMPKEVRDRLPQSMKAQPPAALALKFIAGKEGIKTILSGMSTLEQAIENAQSMTKSETLTPGESELLLLAAEEIRKIPTYPCTRCCYCLEVCPKNMPIPQIIAKRNQNLRGGEVRIPEAQECIACGACEARCPQKIAIRKVMSECVDDH